MKDRTVDISKYRDRLPPIPYGEFLVIGIFDIVCRFDLIPRTEWGNVGLHPKYSDYAYIWVKRRFNGLHIETK